ncbi:hypothetical protein [Luteibacter sp. SG786]|uniref:hypothetical protein n=1 Tax=Luteibacter sp. SG786 TaxID=2587130 RepID=UPI00141DCF60|nr:hypothetical protein [Luteibacter sp. SG786]NII53781.1 hypothetical protein [Luteibacter sp. SG786]
MYTRNVKALGAAALICLLLPAAAFAKDPEGVWSGTLKRENLNTVDAEVRFSDSSVHFGSPYRCSVPIVRGADASSLTYTFGTSTGGGMFCQGLEDVTFVLTPDADGKVIAIAFATNGTIGKGKWAGKLRPASKPSP